MSCLSCGVQRAGKLVIPKKNYTSNAEKERVLNPVCGSIFRSEIAKIPALARLQVISLYILLSNIVYAFHYCLRDSSGLSESGGGGGLFFIKPY